MKKKIFWGIVIICLSILIFQLGKQNLSSIFNLQPKAGLKITSTPEATVYINGLEVSKTPYLDENLSPGGYLVKLTHEDVSWQGKAKLTKGTLSIINRTLSPNIASASGESLVLDEGKGLLITSNPTGVDVEIDSVLQGKTPLFLWEFSSGEHNLTFNHEGYQKRILNITLPPNSLLHINVDLALSSINSFKAPTPALEIVKKALIKQTPLGYLRLREKPSISSKEIGQVSAGEELIIIEEVPGWVKVRLTNNQEGYVSTQYIERKS